MNKFKIGDNVVIVGGSMAGRGGIIVEIGTIEFTESETYERVYWVEEKGIETKTKVPIYEINLEKVAANIFEESVSANVFMESHPELYQERKPKFRPGDVVVTRTKSSNIKGRFCYVLESTFISNEPKPSQYMYKIGSIESPDEIDIFEEYDLIFKYHDKQFERYLYESVGNGLPAWRGELYNVYALYTNPETHIFGELDEELIKDYKDHIIPPKNMEHILRSHSIYDRITDVFKSTENKNIIARNLGISISELNRLKDKTRKTINAINSVDKDPEYEIDISSKYFHGFGKDEIQFINEIDKLDISKKQFKDHYPYKMTNIQIMRSIKEAYINAKKISSRKIQKDTENDRYPEKIKYEGITKKGLIIQFWFNFDLNIIESAWPIRMNNNNKKY